MGEFLKCNPILSHAFAKTRPLHSFRFDTLKKFSVAGPYCTFKLVLHMRQKPLTDVEFLGERFERLADFFGVSDNILQ